MKNLLFTLLITFQLSAFCQDDKSALQLEIYGHTMLDVGYNFNQIHPDWYDVMRPTQLPSYKNEFGTDGNIYYSVRQTRFGIKSSVPVKNLELKTIFEFELFGVGADAGQTTFRLRHAYGELGQIGAGQTWSTFMDIDVFPNSLEYWGPSGMIFYRNIQVKWMPLKGQSKMTIGLEQPGFSSDKGKFEDVTELDSIVGQFPLPDLTAEYRLGRDWGYIELAGILRYVKWHDNNTNQAIPDMSGEAYGYGFNLSTNLKFTKKDVFRGQLVYGKGIQNYMNDASADLGIKDSTELAPEDVIVETLPALGVVAFIDHKWSDKFSTSIGYSLLNTENSGGQTGEAFKKGQYALINLLYYPVENMVAGIEFQWIERENKNGFKSNASKIQLSFKYQFSHLFKK